MRYGILLAGCLLGVIFIAGCGKLSGPPHVGSWQCTKDDALTMDIEKNDEGFVLTHRTKGKDKIRQNKAILDGNTLITQNWSGAQTALKVNDQGQLVCSTEDRFIDCACSTDPYKKI